MNEPKVEKNYGKLRNNDWKWSREIDTLMEFYSKKLCECGCGNKIHFTRKSIRDSRYKKRPLRFLPGHHNRMPEANIGRGENHPMYGKQHTPEALEKMSEAKRGSKCRFWKGGLSKPSLPFRRRWNAIRLQILTRDKNTCQKCNNTNCRLDVHHIQIRRDFKTSEQANSFNNLITLCAKCHMIEENKLRKAKIKG